MMGGLVSAPFGLAFGPGLVIPSSWEQYAMLAGITLTGYFGQILQTKGSNPLIVHASYNTGDASTLFIQDSASWSI
jgi:hypothetical protein